MLSTEINYKREIVCYNIRHYCTQIQNIYIYNILCYNDDNGFI